MLGYVGLVALLMFAGLAWQISQGKRTSSHPHFLTSPDEMSFDVADEEQSALDPEEVRIVPREEPPADDQESRPRRTHRRAKSIDINPDWFSAVKDNTVGIRQHEARAYYRVLAKAKETPWRDLDEAAERDALYVNLMTSPELYRGKPILVVGELRKLTRFQAPPNDEGLDTLYDAWILTSDSGTNPLRIVSSSLSADLSLENSVGQTVKATGYFFKREGYETVERRLHVAPTLLAGRLSLYVSPQAPPPTEQVVPWMMGVIGAIGLAMLATVIGFAVSDRRANRWRSAAGESERLDVGALQRADQRLSIHESLRRLANDEPLTDSHAADVTGNGHLAAELPDELRDLPIPLPPTRAGNRWGERRE